jgi:hypothetical protein
VAADYCAFKFVWDNAKAAYLGINLRDEELACTADLLRLGLYLNANHAVTQHNPLRVQLHSASLVFPRVVYLDELFSLPK